MSDVDRLGALETESWHGDTPVAANDRPMDVPPRYELGAELGRGAMAVVYAALDRQLDRKVALKVLQAHRGGEEEQQRLVREAQALAKLRHPAVVTVYDVTMHAGRVFVAMELVEGPTLRVWSRAGGRTQAQRLAACLGAGRGLVAVHAAGLVHRDFKPDNVLVDHDASARVADFGLVRLALDKHESGTIVGTLAYMPPEVLRGEGADARSDQYAFAVTLAEILGGKRPFDGDTRETHLAATAKPPELDDSIPKWIRALCSRGLAVDPDDRFESMAALLDALGRDPSRRRKRILAGGGAFLAVGAGAFAMAFAMRGGPDAPACVLPATVEAAWSPAKKLAVTTALDAIEADTSVRGSVLAAFDRYRANLVAAHTTACATRATDAPELVAMRDACLERRAAALASMTDSFVTLDPKELDRVVPAAQNLAPVEDCTTSGMLATPIPKAVLADVISIEADLVAAQTYNELGRFAEAKLRLEKLVPRMTTLGHAPTEAEMWLQYGTALESTDRVPDAEQAFRRAVVLAQTGHADGLLVRSAIALALDIGRIQRKPEDGRTWADLALATVSRMPPAPWLESHANFALAVIDLAEHKADDAEVHATKAFELCTRTAGQRSLACANQLNTLGGVALAKNQLDLAATRYQGALAISESVLGHDNVNGFAFVANLASVAYGRGDFAKSAELRADLVARATRTLGPKHSRIGDTNLVLGMSLEMSGRLADGIAATRTGIDIILAARGPTAERALEGKAQLARQLAKSGDKSWIPLMTELAASPLNQGIVLELMEAEALWAMYEHRETAAREAYGSLVSLATGEHLRRVEPYIRATLALAKLQIAAHDPAAKHTAELAVELARELFAPTASPVVEAEAVLAGLP